LWLKSGGVRMDSQQQGNPSHPIEGLMNTAMQSIKEMVDVNTVVGDAVETNDGTVIIPVSQVSCGFAAGGGEYDVSGGNGSKGQELPLCRGEWRRRIGQTGWFPGSENERCTADLYFR